jgi:hypothetical protein
VECPVVKIKFDNEQGYCLLNESDFDETKHVLFTEPSVTESSGTKGTAKLDEPATAAKTQDVGGAALKQPWVSKKDKP